MPTVAVSGGFDPIHDGHIALIREAAKHGDVIVILNSDEWLKRKKGYAFMDYQQRSAIIYAIKGVLDVVPADDGDGTVCATLAKLRPDYFANGGDRKPDNTPELRLCTELGIKPLFNIGGEKVASSSEIVGRVNV
jgi:D-beta-D-heptose 7-phosphate kinase/D-beta-D-heptose 1-phosphate adenosyltransferase